LKRELARWLGFALDVPVIGCSDVAASTMESGEAFPHTPQSLSHIAGQLGSHAGIHLVPWIAQPSPPDLTCGAETRLLGLGDNIGAVCIVGRHTHHCTVEHGRLVAFSTEITSEVRDLLLSTGTLALAASDAQIFDMPTFQSWIERALDTDNTPPIFAIEAAIHQGILLPAHKAAALAGLMIGADVAAHYDPGDEVLLVADGPLLEAYGFALEALGAEVEETSALEALQNGLFELADLAGLLGEA
jgi:2-dehydro-3-deoxygalactonokinase